MCGNTLANFTAARFVLLGVCIVSNAHRQGVPLLGGQLFKYAVIDDRERTL